MKWYNKEVNEAIYSQPKFIGEILMGVTSRTTLTKYFGELAAAKILSPSKDGREVYYINEDLAQILKN